MRKIGTIVEKRITYNKSDIVHIVNDLHNNNRILIHNEKIIGKFNGSTIVDPNDVVLYSVGTYQTDDKFTKFYYQYGKCVFKEEYCSGGNRIYLDNDSNKLGSLKVVGNDITIYSKNEFDISLECPVFVMSAFRQ